MTYPDIYFEIKEVFTENTAPIFVKLLEQRAYDKEFLTSINDDYLFIDGSNLLSQALKEIALEEWAGLGSTYEKAQFIMKNIQMSQFISFNDYKKYSKKYKVKEDGTKALAFSLAQLYPEGQFLHVYFNGNSRLDLLDSLVEEMKERRSYEAWLEQQKQVKTLSVRDFIKSKVDESTFEDLDDLVSYVPASLKDKAMYKLYKAKAYDRYSAGKVLFDFITDNKAPQKELKPGLMKLSYKDLVKAYFGLDLKTGDNTPKLAKQLKKAGIKYTEQELNHFGEVETWFAGAGLTYSLKGPLYADLTDFTIPDNVNDWSFGDSCHNTGSSAGSDTNLILKQMGYKYLRVFSVNDSKAYPFARAYFKAKKGDVAHAGTYSLVKNMGDRENKTAYKFTTVLLATIMHKKIDDFKAIEGMGLKSGSCYEGIDGEDINFWPNMSNNNDYRTVGTAEILEEDTEERWEDLLDNYSCNTRDYEDRGGIDPFK